ncbi:MAG: hypothetical protein M1818_005141 [Claussenomyces sp. TS43310]|nr:MAG: hypothetical protein M1818_005141 [Claussenomyces sp. TS43310]
MAKILPSFIEAAFGLARHEKETQAKKRVNPLSYPKSTDSFSMSLFKNPTSEYRGCPFWVWNCRLHEAQLLRQIDVFEKMGMGGVTIHVRTGLDTEYLGEEFMNLINSSASYLESKGLSCNLYDDDRWPSGAAGGKVIQENAEHKGKHLLFTPHAYGTVEPGGNAAPTSGAACRSENGYLLATYDIQLDEAGRLRSAHRIKKGESAKHPWYAYVETNPGSPWFNGQTYVDTLSKDAMAHFIKTTHEVYKDKIGDQFGTIVPSIFTDEPQFAIKTKLSNPKALDDVFLPWTEDLPETFEKEYFADLVDDIPQLFWDLPKGEASVARYRWHDHVCERFVSAFMDQIGDWCRKNNILLTGHMMEEPTLHSQTSAIGEAMRCYRNMGMPGIDLLMDQFEFTTAKQASSVARQNGIKGVLSEIYGVTHWYFTFEGHKGCGDWQAALGITYRVHHLALVSMAGESKRDYPASISYQSPWHEEYPYVEDHFARVGVAMTRGQAVTRIGVIHPIESYWLCYGPNGGGDEQDRRSQAFLELTDWLLRGLIDFDFISESLLPKQGGRITKGRRLTVGKCEYDLIIVPNLRTVRSSTLKILQSFSDGGGKVIIAGSAPDLVDGKPPSSDPFIRGSKSVYWSQQNILGAIETYRDLRITTDAGDLTNSILYQMRQDSDERFVFICNTDRQSAFDTTVHAKGCWDVKEMDTLTGDISSIESSSNAGWTAFSYRFEGCASLLLHLLPKTQSNISSMPTTVCQQAPTMTESVELESIVLTEPNVLLLDYAEYKLDDDPWSEPTEVLRLDNDIRAKLELPLRQEAWRQPWTVPQSERKPKAHLTMNFLFESTFAISEPTLLALEEAAAARIHVNRIGVPSGASTGWWVDEAVRTVVVPGNIIRKGWNVISIALPFGVLTNVERVYLLGSFAVTLDGHAPTLHPLDLASLSWGDITTQGMPFYAGNVIYNCKVTVPTAPTTVVDLSTLRLSPRVTLSVPDFASPVLTVHDSDMTRKLGRIALQPRALPLGRMAPGEHRRLAITAFGNRYNAFGHLHLTNDRTLVCNPSVWRTVGDWWTDDYNVKPIGVLTCPSISVAMEQGEDKVLRMEDGEWVVVRGTSLDG